MNYSRIKEIPSVEVLEHLQSRELEGYRSGGIVQYWVNKGYYSIERFIWISIGSYANFLAFFKLR